MSLLTVRESIRACIRKIFDSIMDSSTSQRMFRSEDMPWARIVWTWFSMSEMVMASLPTTAMVLSMSPPGYFWADRVRDIESAEITAAVFKRYLIIF